MTTVVSILVSDLVPLRSRGTWQGVLNIVFATGSATGAPLGGLLADTIGWRWAFLIQVPATMLAIIVVILCLNLPATSEPQQTSAATTFKTRLARVDFMGAGVLILAVLSLLIECDQLSNYALQSTRVIVPLLAAIAFFSAFAYTESAVAAEPFAPPHIVRERTILASCLANFFSFAAYMMLLFFLPLYFQAADGLSASEAGVRLLPAIAGAVAGSLSGGIIMQKTGKYYWLTVMAYSLPISGSLIVLASTFMAPGHAYSLGITAGIAMTAFGNGIGVTTTLIAVIAAAGAVDQAVATAVSYLFRALGTVSGLAVGSMLVQKHLRAALVRRLGQGDVADEIVRGVRGSLEYIGTLPKDIQAIVRACYKESVQVAYMFSVVLAVGALISASFLKERRLGR